MWRAASVLTLALLIAGCSSAGDLPRQTSIIPKGNLRLFPEYAVSFADLVQIGAVVGVVYLVTDPLSPSWSISETRLEDERVIYQLKKQYVSFGGEGEARYIMTRRADALSREQGRKGYVVERYEEALDSRMLLPYRTAYAEIRLDPAERLKTAERQRTVQHRSPTDGVASPAAIDTTESAPRSTD